MVLMLISLQAGEDLEEIEEEDEVLLDNEPLPASGSRDFPATAPTRQRVSTIRIDAEEAVGFPSERSPLISRAKSRSASRRRKSIGPHGDATVGQAILMVRTTHHVSSCLDCSPAVLAFKVIRRYRCPVSG